ncbi:MAG: flagellar protein F [Candidatus Thermoplasmatota archaeon]|jgi:flagellar protein FlaF|nr:flagellar protein F [Candidatus Thermoplasmatota archaeon]
MGFSYVVAVAILLSSSLIFFGVIYSDYVHTNTEISQSEQGQSQRMYDMINSKVNITEALEAGNSSQKNVTINLVNSGSVTLYLNQTNVLVNGTIHPFNFTREYLFPLQNETISFTTSLQPVEVEIVFNTGYKAYVEVR